MAPKSARGKKGKDKKGKKGQKDEVFTNVDKAFCHLTITDLNKKLAHLRQHLSELEEQNIALKKDNEFVGDRKDAADFMQRKLEKTEQEFKVLEKEYEHITQIREQESLEYQMKIKDLEQLNKSMQEQLLFEIKMLQSKLNSLEEFRYTRELLLSKLEAAENAVSEKEEESRIALFEMEQKALVEKDNLKKGIEMQLLHLAEDFAKSNEIRASGYTRRLIRENIALHKEIELLISSHIKMKHQYDEYVFRNKVIMQNYSALEETNRNLMLNSQNQIQVIENLTGKLDQMVELYNILKKQRNVCEYLYEKSECKRFNFGKVKAQLQSLMVIIDELKLENATLTSTTTRYENEIRLQKETLNELKETIEIFLGIKKHGLLRCKLPGEEEEMDTEECEALIMEDKRQNLLSKLLDIINANEEAEEIVVCTPKESRESLYHPGEIGFIPGFDKSSLMDLFVNEIKRRDSLSTKSRSIVGSLHVDDLRIPTPCHVDGNSIEDFEMGSLFIASDEKSDEPQVFEEEEPLEYADNASSSSEKDAGGFICEKEEEKVEEPKAPVEEPEEVKKEECDSVDFDITKKMEALGKADVGEEEADAEGGAEEALPKGEEEEDEDNEFPPFFFY